MALPAPVTVEIATAAKPRDDELDLFGITHPGLVRKENQDHFLLCTLHRQMVVHGTSLPDFEQLPLRSQRIATLAMVADGVGGSAGGAEASRLAIEVIGGYVGHAMQCFHGTPAHEEEKFQAALTDAVLEAHAAVRAEAAARARPGKMATTLTLLIGIWPRGYVVQVGDSRCYFWDGDALTRVTRDQTVAQALVDSGALPAHRLEASPYSGVLASAIGGAEALPVLTTFTGTRGCAVLLCTDGLTKHVSDDEIAEQLRAGQPSEPTCRTLLDLALERGGTDNVTVLLARVPR